MPDQLTVDEQDSHETCDIAIVGAGLAGLSCARKLSTGSPSGSLNLRVLEASDRVGGRVRTDVIDGLKLDHGFQVMLTAYPACRELLDYDGLRLRSFEPGALVRKAGRFHRLGDPWRRPLQAVSTAISPVGSFADKLRIGKVRALSSRGSLDALYQRDHEPTVERLKRLGFSEAIIEEFFRPFLGGVFLDESLATSSRMFEFVFRMFAAGDIAIPADGMAAIPRQLADGLPRGTLQLNRTVTALDAVQDYTRVRFADGSELKAKSVVIATESNGAARLLDREELATQWNETTTLYYTAPTSPNSQRLLMLRGDDDGPIQTAVVLSDVAPEYATRGRALVSISVSQAVTSHDLDTLRPAILEQARRWFGPSTEQWDFVQSIRVPYGLPVSGMDPVLKPIESIPFGGDVFLCGDHMESPSIQGAMNSGIRVANHLLTRQFGKQ